MDTNPQAENAAPIASSPAAEAAPAATPVPETPAPNPLFVPPNADDILFGGFEAKEAPKAAPAAEAVATPTPPAETPAAPETPPAGETPPATETETPPAEPADPELDGLPNRVRTEHMTYDERRAFAKQAQLRKAGQTVSFTEAMKLIDREDTLADKAAAKAAEAPAAPDPVAQLEQEVAELEAKVEDGTLVGPELRLYVKKHAQLEGLKARQEMSQTHQVQSLESQQIAARDAAVGDYPAVTDADSHLGAAVAAEVAALKSEAHPDHGLLSKPDAPLAVVRRVANRLAESIAARQGITKEQALASLSGKPVPAAAKAPPAPPPVVPTAPPAPKPASQMPLTVASGNQPPAPVAKGPTAKELVQQSIANPKFDYDAALELTGDYLATR